MAITIFIAAQAPLRPGVDAPDQLAPGHRRAEVVAGRHADPAAVAGHQEFAVGRHLDLELRLAVLQHLERALPVLAVAGGADDIITQRRNGRQQALATEGAVGRKERFRLADRFVIVVLHGNLQFVRRGEPVPLPLPLAQHPLVENGLARPVGGTVGVDIALDRGALFPRILAGQFQEGQAVAAAPGQACRSVGAFPEGQPLPVADGAAAGGQRADLDTRQRRSAQQIGGKQQGAAGRSLGHQPQPGHQESETGRGAAPLQLQQITARRQSGQRDAAETSVTVAARLECDRNPGNPLQRGNRNRIRLARVGRTIQQRGRRYAEQQRLPLFDPQAVGAQRDRLVRQENLAVLLDAQRGRFQLRHQRYQAVAPFADFQLLAGLLQAFIRHGNGVASRRQVGKQRHTAFVGLERAVDRAAAQVEADTVNLPGLAVFHYGDKRLERGGAAQHQVARILFFTGSEIVIVALLQHPARPGQGRLIAMGVQPVETEAAVGPADYPVEAVRGNSNPGHRRAGAVNDPP